MPPDHTHPTRTALQAAYARRATAPADPHLRFEPPMPADPPLTTDERRVLEVLMEPDRGVPDRTVDEIAEAAAMTWQPTWNALRALEMRRPQLAHPEVDATLNMQFWRTTSDAADALAGE